MRTELLDLSKVDGCACGGRCVGCNDAATAVGTRVYGTNRAIPAKSGGARFGSVRTRPNVRTRDLVHRNMTDPKRGPARSESSSAACHCSKAAKGPGARDGATKAQSSADRAASTIILTPHVSSEMERRIRALRRVWRVDVSQLNPDGQGTLVRVNGREQARRWIGLERARLAAGSFELDEREPVGFDPYGDEMPDCALQLSWFEMALLVATVGVPNAISLICAGCSDLAEFSDCLDYAWLRIHVWYNDHPTPGVIEVEPDGPSECEGSVPGFVTTSSLVGWEQRDDPARAVCRPEVEQSFGDGGGGGSIELADITTGLGGEVGGGLWRRLPPALAGYAAYGYDHPDTVWAYFKTSGGGCRAGFWDDLPTWVSVGMTPYVVYKVLEMGWVEDPCDGPRPYMVFRFWLGMANHVQVLNQDPVTAWESPDRQQEGMRVAMFMTLVDASGVTAQIRTIRDGGDGLERSRTYVCRERIADYQVTVNTSEGLTSVPSGDAIDTIGEAQSTLGVIGRVDVRYTGEADEPLDWETLSEWLPVVFERLFGEKIEYSLQVRYTFDDTQYTANLRRCLRARDLHEVTRWSEAELDRINTDRLRYAYQELDLLHLQIDAGM